MPPPYRYPNSAQYRRPEPTPEIRQEQEIDGGKSGDRCDISTQKSRHVRKHPGVPAQRRSQKASHIRSTKQQTNSAKNNADPTLAAVLAKNAQHNQPDTGQHNCKIGAPIQCAGFGFGLLPSQYPVARQREIAEEY